MLPFKLRQDLQASAIAAKFRVLQFLAAQAAAGNQSLLRDVEIFAKKVDSPWLEEVSRLARTARTQKTAMLVEKDEELASFKLLDKELLSLDGEIRKADLNFVAIETKLGTCKRLLSQIKSKSQRFHNADAQIRRIGIWAVKSKIVQ